MTSIAHKPLTRSSGSVRAVSANAKHGFSKRVRDEIMLIANYGVDGNAHAGSFVKHRYLARWRPRMPNERQVHLIDDSLFDALRCEGFEVNPGGLGENITTHGVDLLRLPVRHNTETWERRRHRTERAAHPLQPYRALPKRTSENTDPTKRNAAIPSRRDGDCSERWVGPCQRHPNCNAAAAAVAGIARALK